MSKTSTFKIKAAPDPTLAWWGLCLFLLLTKDPWSHCPPQRVNIRPLVYRPFPASPYCLRGPQVQHICIALCWQCIKKIIIMWNFWIRKSGPLVPLKVVLIFINLSAFACLMGLIAPPVAELFNKSWRTLWNVIFKKHNLVPPVAISSSRNLDRLFKSWIRERHQSLTF